MLTLLDEQIDVRIKAALADFPVFTVQEKGWSGLKNGELRAKLNHEKFRYFVAADKNMPFQQNLQAVDFTIILIDTPTLIWEHQQQFLPKLTGLLTSPPTPLPILIHIAVNGLSRGKKIAALRQLATTEQILFL